MNLEEAERANEWSNEQYFDYMKTTGKWVEHGRSDETGISCDRCGHHDLDSWKVESIIEVVAPRKKSYCIGTEFNICTLCMLELCGSTSRPSDLLSDERLDWDLSSSYSTFATHLR